MPIYEYQCLDCQEAFEMLQLSRESSERAECPHCGSQETEKLVSTFAAAGIGGDVFSGPSCGSSGSGFR